LDMGNLNFNAGLSSGNITRFFDNQPFTVGGFTYMDTVEVISDGGTTYSDYAGPNLWYDPYTGMTSGTITGIFAGTFSAGNLLVIQDIAVTAYALGSATATPSTADDYALFASIFQGSDLFLLSDKGDRAFGFGGNDTLKGYGGTDWLYGNQGNDLLQGQNSNDLLDGGQGRDKLTGGRGNDVFQFVSPRDGGDIITDFHNKRGDNDGIFIDVSGFGGGRRGELDPSQFQSGTTNVAQDDDTRFVFRTTDETLWFDANGDDRGGRTLIADLQGNASLSHNDILLV
jgi:Ca2+-binding RTX toxin-like protein